MYSRFCGPKFLVLIYFLTCFNSIHAQRLQPQRKLTEPRVHPRYLTWIFNRIFTPFRNLKQEIRSFRNGNFDSSLYPPETFLSTPEIIRLHGYPVEEHKVTTTDGYIISIFRIIHTKKDADSAVNLEPVLVQHGLTCSSDDFLQLNKTDILPYLLADSGHNVWLGNVRGNTYGKQHANNISSNDHKFYDFSMDEPARDLPQIIKYILKVENVPQLSYVCHSMGCSFISMAVSEEPGLNDLVKKGSFLAPGPYNTYASSSLALALTLFPEAGFLSYARRFSGGRLVPLSLSLAMRKYAPGICLRESTRHFCNSFIALSTGINPGQITNETLVKVFGHFPAETSMKLLVQSNQIGRSGNFKKYDYGMEKNLEFYGSSKPPLYNFSSVVFPVQGFYSVGDDIASPKDVFRVWSELGNLVETIQVEDEKWGHLDFIYGKDARKLIYEKIVRFLSS